MKKVNRITALLAAALGIYAMAGGLDLHIFTSGGQPASGMFPFFLGALLVLIGILLCADSFRAEADGRPVPFIWAEVYNLLVIVVPAVAVVLLTPFLGLVVPIGLMAGALAALMGERRIAVLAALAIVTPAFMYLFFGLGLGVPLPMGIFET